MTTPNTIDPKEVINPGTGLYYRNPTHLDESKRAQNQTEIVKQIIGAGRETQHDVLDYSDIDTTELPGFRKLLEYTIDEEGRFVYTMSDTDIQGLCKSLLRSRPNIFSFKISLGNYPTKKLDNVKTRDLGANRPRFQTEVATALSEVLSDRNLRVVEVNYVIQNHIPGRFIAVAEVYSTTKEEYENLENFSPIIERDYFPNA